jgi:RloB-like protein
MPKPNANRAYKKGEPHRDSRLFVIVAEGEREDKYFSQFNQINSRIRVLIVPREQGLSAPKHFIGRLDEAQKAGIYSAQENDPVWFVCDVDRWAQQIHELQADCRKNNTWNLVVSNPCFEVWLHYHSGPVSVEISHCHELKRQLPQTNLGEFRPDLYAKHMEQAVLMAEQAHTNLDSHFPSPMQTTVYRLAKEILNLLGNNWP